MHAAELPAMPFIHLAARSVPGVFPFECHAAASWTWSCLNELFPDTYGAVLMPNHVQLVVEVRDVAVARASFARSLGHLQRWWTPGVPVWERVRAPKIVAPGQAPHRDLRYLGLNPPRARLCRDPLEWPWTTHRDVMGAAMTPWVDMDRILRVWQPFGSDPRAEWHRYVSGDTCVAVEGTPPPQAASKSDVATRSLHEIRCAAAAALRVPASKLHGHPYGPRLFLALARDQGWDDATVLASAICRSPRQVRRELAVDPAALRAASCCLGDRRLWEPFAEDEPTRRKQRGATQHDRDRSPGNIAPR